MVTTGVLSAQHLAASWLRAAGVPAGARQVTGQLARRPSSGAQRPAGLGWVVMLAVVCAASMALAPTPDWNAVLSCSLVLAALGAVSGLRAMTVYLRLRRPGRFGVALLAVLVCGFLLMVLVVTATSPAPV